MKTDTDNLLLFVELYKKIDAAARVIISDHAREQLSERVYDCLDLFDFQISGIEDDGIRYSVEYNDACGCHPEMQTASVYIPWDDIEYQMVGTEEKS